MFKSFRIETNETQVLQLKENVTMRGREVLPNLTIINRPKDHNLHLILLLPMVSLEWSECEDGWERSIVSQNEKGG